MKLISMVDFVLADKYAGSPINTNKQYADFLKQPLELWMFVPCDEDGDVLEEIKPYQDNYFKYQKAKERCLFEVFFDLIALRYHISRGRTVEYFAQFDSLQLTPTALKQIGL